MEVRIPFTSIILFPDPDLGDFLMPEADIEGYAAQVGDLVTDGKRTGRVHKAAALSPYWGDPDWRVYVGNLPGEPAWSDYWTVYEVEIIETKTA